MLNQTKESSKPDAYQFVLNYFLESRKKDIEQDLTTNIVLHSPSTQIPDIHDTNKSKLGVGVENNVGFNCRDFNEYITPLELPSVLRPNSPNDVTN